MQQFDIVIYHSNCPDGLTGAWVFWKYLQKTAEFLPFKHGDSPPDVTDKRVVIVDFSFPRDVTLQMLKTAKKLVVLDHHKSAERELENILLENNSFGNISLENIPLKPYEIVFNMKRSGAQIAWDYVYNCSGHDNRPWFVNYVADRDLWQHKLPNTKEISQGLFSSGYFTNFEKLNELTVFNEKDIQHIVEKGTLLLEQTQKEVEFYAKTAVPTILTIDGKEFNVNLAASPRVNRSEVGNYICSNQKCDFSAVYWFNYALNVWYISLRASENSDCDLSEISSRLPTGGGHRKAAGFTIYGSQNENLYTYFKKL